MYLVIQLSVSGIDDKYRVITNFAYKSFKRTKVLKLSEKCKTKVKLLSGLKVPRKITGADGLCREIQSLLFLFYSTTYLLLNI